MSFVLKEGQGTLFKNSKEGNEARPDYRGEVNLAGTIYRISGWLKEGKNGKWMSLSVEVPQQRPTEPERMRKHDVDGDIPF